jgi:hypothetical protein
MHKLNEKLMTDIKTYYQLVENCITKLGVDPSICRDKNPGQWNLRKGSADVWIDVFKRPEDEWGYFQCMAPVSKVPASNVDAFLTEVLEISHTLYGVGFTKFKDYIYVKTIRELEDLSEDEMMAMIRRIGGYADDYDDYFANKYFGGGGSPKSV